MQIRKKGDEIQKKSSPLKLLSQSQPNFAAIYKKVVSNTPQIHRVMNVTFNNISVISWPSVLWVEETGVPRENHRPAASN